MVEFVKYEEPKSAKLYKFGKFSVSTIELKHLSFALFMTILTIIVHQEGLEILNPKKLFTLNVLLLFVAYIFSIGLGFILHEFGHKLVAQHYGFISEFRADFTMLIFMFFFAMFSGFIFLAPGAVMILGRVSRRQNGIISVAGPLVNLVLALIFIIFSILFPSNGFLGYIFSIGIYVNAFLGLFNMLPFWVLDGKKVLAWNKQVYFLVVIALGGILYLKIKGLF